MKNYRWLYFVIAGAIMCLVAFILRYVQNKKKDKVEEEEVDTTSDKTLVLRIPKFYRGIALLVLLLCIAFSIWISIPVMLGRKELLELMWLVPLWMMGGHLG